MQVSQLTSLVQPAAPSETASANGNPNPAGGADFQAIMAQITDSAADRPVEGTAVSKDNWLATILPLAMAPSGLAPEVAAEPEAASKNTDESSGASSLAAGPEPGKSVAENEPLTTTKTEDLALGPVVPALIFDLSLLPETYAGAEPFPGLETSPNPAAVAGVALFGPPAAVKVTEQGLQGAPAAGADSISSLLQKAQPEPAGQFAAASHAVAPAREALSDQPSPASVDASLLSSSSRSSTPVFSSTWSVSEDSASVSSATAREALLQQAQAGGPIQFSEPLSSATTLEGDVTLPRPAGKPAQDGSACVEPAGVSEAASVVSSPAMDSPVVPAASRTDFVSAVYSASGSPELVGGIPSNLPSGEPRTSAQGNVESPISQDQNPPVAGAREDGHLVESLVTAPDQSRPGIEPGAGAPSKGESESLLAEPPRGTPSAGSPEIDRKTSLESAPLEHAPATSAPPVKEPAGASESMPIEMPPARGKELVQTEGAPKRADDLPWIGKQIPGAKDIPETADPKPPQVQMTQGKNLEMTAKDQGLSGRTSPVAKGDAQENTAPGLAISPGLRTESVPKTTTSPASKTAALVFELADRIQSQLQSGQGELRIQLRPEHLGALEIKAESRAEGIIARIAAETGSVKQYLESNLHILQQNLQDQGLKVDRIDVVLQPNLDPRNAGGQNHQSGQAGSGHTAQNSDNGSNSTRANSPLGQNELVVDPATALVLGPNSTFHTIA